MLPPSHSRPGLVDWWVQWGVPARMDGTALLHIGARCDNTGLGEILLKARADPNAPDHADVSHMFVQRRHL